MIPFLVLLVAVREARAFTFSSSALSSSSSTSGGSASILLDSFHTRDLAASDPCYDDKTKKAAACMPDFVNAAFGVKVKEYGAVVEPGFERELFITSLI
jgi:hypothetical protein